MGSRASVIIPVHNAAQDLRQQLKALEFEARNIDFEVIVVDNNSADKPELVVESFAHAFSGIRAIRATERAGAGYARNVGARAATSSTLLFCDADDIIKTGWVTSMVAGAELFSIAGGVSDTKSANDPAILVWYGTSISHLSKPITPTIFGQWNVVASNSMALESAVFEDLGGFDERFDVGAEDLDLCLRVQARGGSVGLAPGASIDYSLRATRSGMLRQQLAYGRAWAQLYATHKTLLTSRWGLRSELRLWLRMIVRLPELLTNGRRENFAREIVWNVGRLTRGARARVFVPL